MNAASANIIVHSISSLPECSSENSCKFLWMTARRSNVFCCETEEPSANSIRSRSNQFYARTPLHKTKFNTNKIPWNCISKAKFLVKCHNPTRRYPGITNFMNERPPRIGIKRVAFSIWLYAVALLYEINCHFRL